MINITALWRPYCQEMVDRIERYRDSKSKNFSYDFLDLELREALKDNYGMVIYHEDLLRIIAHYSKWTLERCEALRKSLCSNRKNLAVELPDLEEFKRLAPQPVVELILAEIPHTFCQAHAFAFASFTKCTLILKSLHRKTYYEEIEKWEAKHGLKWDDVGVKLKGVSLLQN